VGGALIGFGAGLFADFAPPADHAAGRYALVLCVIGYAAGLAKPEIGQVRSASLPLLVVGAAAIGSTLLYALVGALVGDTAARHVGLGELLFTAVLYDLLLTPFTVPWIMALARKVDNDPMANDAVGGGGIGPYRWGTPGSSRSGRISRTRIGSQRTGLLKGGRKL
jgi:rod shape-determining protein MreD